MGVGQSVDRLKRPIARPVGLQNKEMFKLNTGRRKNEGLRFSLPLTPLPGRRRRRPAVESAAEPAHSSLISNFSSTFCDFFANLK